MEASEVMQKLDAADIANARLNGMEEFWRHPQLAARGRFAKVGSPAGEIDVLKPAANIEGMDPRIEAIPDVGQHSRALLAELGYSDQDIARLAAEGVI
jgi:crotonobetainyl-CoA:carnitine CoA-transferase CaiB-like acyl-CoA transferase